jgi:hypothetical protein
VLGLGLNLGLGTRAPSGGAALPAVTWSPTDKDAEASLSNGNLTVAQVGGDGIAQGRATRGASSGKVYWEIVVVAGGGETRISFADSSAPFTGLWDATAHGGGYIHNSAGTRYNSADNFTYATVADGNVVGVALDASNKKIWFAVQNVWQNGDPAAGTSGLNISAISTPILPAYGLVSGTSTAHFDSGSFTYTPPSGFSAL